MNKPKNDFPIQLDNPRAWRTYIGGSNLDALHDIKNGENGHFPEEWIMSVVSARNAGREELAEEGMSHIYGTETTLKHVLSCDPTYYLGAGHTDSSLGVLVKLIDSAERLTLQVHPDHEQAKLLFNSEYGKTECWHILDTCPIGDETPCIYLGFKENVTREYWKHLFDTQDIDGMLNAMQRYEVKKGDTILIEGGMPHAIGSGCFLTEIQEPTDFTIRVERTTPSGFQVVDSMCHQGLGFERMFDAFHYAPMTRQEIYDRWFIKPKYIKQEKGGSIATLIGEADTPLFRLDEIIVTDVLVIDSINEFSGLYILSGEGKLIKDENSINLTKATQFFVPSNVHNFTLKSNKNKPLRIFHFFGPKKISCL